MGVWVIAVIKQNCNLGNIHRLGAKVVHVLAQQVNQATVIAHTSFRAVGEKWQPQGIDGKMPFDAIGTLVMTEPFGFDTGIARILHRL